VAETRGDDQDFVAFFHPFFAEIEGAMLHPVIRTSGVMID
jgi:hypothetical protein